MKSLRSIAVVGTLLCLSGPALAIYKCESASKVTYSDVPCPGGQPIDVEDRVAPAQAAQARKRVAEDRKLLKQAESEKRKSDLKEEREQRRTAKVHAAQQKHCDAMARRQQWANDDARTATAKSAAKAKRKAHRLAEQYEQECGGRNIPRLGISG
jgi:hypothetical protein